MKLLKLFGVDVCESRLIKVKRIEIVLARNIMKAIWIISFFTSISSTFTAIYLLTTSSNKSYIKYFIASLSMSMCSYLIWRQLIQNETKLNKAIRRLHHVTNLLGISPPKSLIMKYYFYLMSMCSISIYLHIYTYNNIDPNEMISAWTFEVTDSRYIDWHLKKFAVHLYFFAKTVGFYFNLAFTGFYVIVCRYMMMILRKHGHINANLLKTKSVTSNDIATSFRRYNSILSMFRDINSLLSYPIFLSTSNNALGVLLSFIILIKSNNGAIEIVLVLVMNFLAFTETTFEASAVHEADKINKINDKKLLQSLTFQDRFRNSKADIDNFWQMTHESPFTLSGWNFFEFTRGIYLTAVGTMITYTLLILQM